MEVGVIRKPKDNYTRVPNTLIGDFRLKPQERFLYIYLISKPDGWVFHRSKVSKELGVNKDTLSRYFQSICDLGWIKKIQTRNIDGSFGAIIIDIYDQPIKPDAVKPIHGETEIENTDAVKHRDGKTDSRLLYSISKNDLINKNEEELSDFEKKSQSEIFENENLSLIEEKKEKKKVAPKKKSPSLFEDVQLWPSFEDFWNLYDKKTGKEKAEPKWDKLKQSEKEKIMEVLPEYVGSTPEKQFRKDPTTYLNGKHWNDEIIKREKKMDAVDKVMKQNGISFQDLAKAMI